MVEVFDVGQDGVGDLAPALGVIHEACTAAGVDYFVIGAAARDLLLQHVYGVRPLRATGDVDVAVTVGGWDEYDALVGRLVEDHDFEPSGEEHRLRRAGLVVDVVPFGRIGGDRHVIVWPGGGRVMSVVGYREAYEAAVGVRIGDAPPVPVASLPGVGVLKLVAWSENPRGRPQDPVDLCAIMTSYEGVVEDRLFTEHGDVLAEEPYDGRVVSSRVYGRDLAPLLRDRDLRGVVLGVLRDNTDEDDDSRLALAMGTECMSDFALRLRCLRAFEAGVIERLA